MRMGESSARTEGASSLLRCYSGMTFLRIVIPLEFGRHARLSRASTFASVRDGQDVDGRDTRAFTPVFDGPMPSHDVLHA